MNLKLKSLNGATCIWYPSEQFIIKGDYDLAHKWTLIDSGIKEATEEDLKDLDLLCFGDQWDSREEWMRAIREDLDLTQKLKSQTGIDLFKSWLKLKRNKQK